MVLKTRWFYSHLLNDIQKCLQSLCDINDGVKANSVDTNTHLTVINYKTLHRSILELQSRSKWNTCYISSRKLHHLHVILLVAHFLHLWI